MAAYTYLFPSFNEVMSHKDETDIQPYAELPKGQVYGVVGSRVIHKPKGGSATVVRLFSPDWESGFREYWSPMRICSILEKKKPPFFIAVSELKKGASGSYYPVNVKELTSEEFDKNSWAWDIEQGDEDMEEAPKKRTRWE